MAPGEPPVPSLSVSSCLTWLPMVAALRRLRKSLRRQIFTEQPLCARCHGDGGKQADIEAQWSVEPQACRGGGRYFISRDKACSFVWEQYKFSEGVHID